MKIFHACPCCGDKNLPDKGEFDICNLCKWEDDPLQRDDPDDDLGANTQSLNQYRAEWAQRNCTQAPDDKPAYASHAV